MPDNKIIFNTMHLTSKYFGTAIASIVSWEKGDVNENDAILTSHH